MFGPLSRLTFGEIFSIVQPRDLSQVMQRPEDSIREKKQLERKPKREQARDYHEPNVQIVDLGSRQRHSLPAP
jgi:hypothetical protein